MFGFDECDVVGAERDGLAGNRDERAVFGESAADADLCRRLAADEPCAGALGDSGRIHRVVEMGVHGQHGLQPVDAHSLQAVVDTGRRRGDPTEPDGCQTRPREEAVGHHRRCAVIDEQCCDACPGHRQRHVG